MGKVLSALTFVLATSSALAAAATPKDSVGAGAPSYTNLFSLVGDVPLGASTSRMDYESIDAGARRLYIAGMGEGKLLAFDIAQNRLVARLDGFPKVTGVLAVPDLHKVYASVPGAGMMPSLFVGLGMAGLSSGRGAVAVVDMANLKELARLPGGVFPDGIAFDPKEHRIFVSDELGSAVLVIDADTNTFLSRIDAGGEVGNVRYDPRHGKYLCASSVTQRDRRYRSEARGDCCAPRTRGAAGIRTAWRSCAAVRPSATSPATAMTGSWSSIWRPGGCWEHGRSRTIPMFWPSMPARTACMSHPNRADCRCSISSMPPRLRLWAMCSSPTGPIRLQWIPIPTGSISRWQI